jgi:hypothetical protein
LRLLSLRSWLRWLAVNVPVPVLLADRVLQLAQTLRRV